MFDALHQLSDREYHDPSGVPEGSLLTPRVLGQRPDRGHLDVGGEPAGRLAIRQWPSTRTQKATRFYVSNFPTGVDLGDFEIGEKLKAYREWCVPAARGVKARAD